MLLGPAFGKRSGCRWADGNNCPSPPRHSLFLLLASFFFGHEFSNLRLGLYKRASLIREVSEQDGKYVNEPPNSKPPRRQKVQNSCAYFAHIDTVNTNEAQENCQQQCCCVAL